MTTKFTHTETILKFLFLICSLCMQNGHAQNSNHKLWNELLSKHVSETGWVNYRGFTFDSLKLNIYLNLLSKRPPQTNWKKEDKIAYWINAYNAFTIQLMIRNPGIQSIREIGGNFPFVNSTWDIKFITLGGIQFDLNEIEHGILRRKFKDPRIHMALVCASVSCPALLNQAFTALRLGEQLDLCAKKFLADTSRNIISLEQLRLSRIFEWYFRDFNGKKGIISFIQTYGPVKNLDPKRKIDYLDYDWSLNGKF